MYYIDIYIYMYYIDIYIYILLLLYIIIHGIVSIRISMIICIIDIIIIISSSSSSSSGGSRSSAAGVEQRVRPRAPARARSLAASSETFGEETKNE